MEKLPKDVKVAFWPKDQNNRSVIVNNGNIERLLGKNAKRVIGVANTTGADLTEMKFRKMGTVKIWIV